VVPVQGDAPPSAAETKRRNLAAGDGLTCGEKKYSAADVVSVEKSLAAGALPKAQLARALKFMPRTFAFGVALPFCSKDEVGVPVSQPEENNGRLLHKVCSFDLDEGGYRYAESGGGGGLKVLKPGQKRPV